MANEMKLDTTFGHPKFYALIKRMCELHSNKNRDYGNGNPLGNFMTAEELGIDPFDGVLVRMSDKWTRICSLRKSGQQFVKDESIEDTLLDLANYAILALVIKHHLKTRDRELIEVDIQPKCPGACEDCHCSCEDTENSDAYLLNLDIPSGKTYQCLHCTNKDTEVNIHTTCGHCVHRDENKNYGVDYFVDQRIVDKLTGNGDDVDSRGYRCVGGQFCACEKCEKERFLNAM